MGERRRHGGSHRNGYEPTSGVDEDYQQQPSPRRSELAQHTAREVGGINAPSPRQRVTEQHRYRLAIDDRCPAAAAAASAAVSNWTLATEIDRVDVRVHRRDGSSVVVDDIPFYFVRK